MPEQQKRPESTLDRLLSMLGGLLFFSTPEGQACVSLPMNPSGREFWPVRSARIRDWLTATFHQSFKATPSAHILNRALSTFEAFAHDVRESRQSLDLRLAWSSSAPKRSIFLDLDNTAGQTVEISPSGWSLHDDNPHAFRRSRGFLPLPEPLRHAGPSGLRRLINLERRELAIVHSWLAAALRPSGPYPILILTGPTGSGKSSAASILRSVLDPSAAPVGPLPTSASALFEFAWHNWILAFDGVRRVPASTANALAQLSSGARHLVRERGAHREPLVFQIGRPIILACSSTAWLDNHPTLRDRSLIVSLSPIEPSARLTESALRASFDLLRPAILGTLCNAASTALRNYSSVKLPRLPRLADFTVWAAAAAPAFNITANDILAALTPPVQNTLHAAALEFLSRNGRWTGTASDLLAYFRSILPPETLPKTAKGLSQALAKMGGIEVIRHRCPGGKLRLLELRSPFEKPAKPSPRAARSAQTAA